MLAFIFLCALLGGINAWDWDVITPLDQYVQSDDGHYSWREIASYNFEGVTLYIINMTSQMYQTEAFSTRPIWWHYMGVAIPDQIDWPEHGFLGIEGGGNEDYDPPQRDELSGLIAVSAANDTKMVTAYIKQVPNQPVYFLNDPTNRRRTEDWVISWTWRTYLESPDPSDKTIIERMPMTKAAKRGLDTIAAVAKWRRPETNIDKFFVTGASKRGWTTWSLGATDRRVVAMAPLVFSLLNMENGTIPQHNMDMDGDWSFALRPYWGENLTQEFYNPKTREIYEIEDLYYYKERFTMPIMAMSSSGDEFFLLDDNHPWWNDIPDPKWLMMLPNAEHTMAPHYLQIYETMLSFIMSVLLEQQLPTVTWTMQNTTAGGFIHFSTNPPPRELKAFWGVTLGNDTRRDFRLAARNEEDETVLHPVFWRQNLTIVDMGNGEYHVEVEKVDGEWLGFFFEGTWDGPTGTRFVATSQVNVIPWTYPTVACTDEVSCWGKLV